MPHPKDRTTSITAINAGGSTTVPVHWHYADQPDTTAKIAVSCPQEPRRTRKPAKRVQSIAATIAEIGEGL